MICRTCGNETRKVVTVWRDGPVDFCPECPRLTTAHKKVSTFPFELPFGLDGSGQRITVNSLHHLRRLERDFKVQNHAYANDERNFAPPQQSRERPRNPMGYGAREATAALEAAGRR